MGKLEVIDGKQTPWTGLWWHPEYSGFSSASISLAELRKFKGNVRLYVRKNKFYNGGKNNEPNYCFCLKDAKAKVFHLLTVEEDPEEAKEDSPYYEGGCYYDERGNRLYTYDEVQYAINRAAEDGRAGYGWGDNIVSDYL